MVHLSLFDSTTTALLTPQQSHLAFAAVERLTVASTVTLPHPFKAAADIPFIAGCPPHLLSEYHHPSLDLDRLAV